MRQASSLSARALHKSHILYSLPIHVHVFKVSYVTDAVACRGSWMPGTNEVLGCSQITIYLLSSKKIFLHSCPKNFTTFFSHSKKILTTFFSPFSQFYLFLKHF